MTVQGSEGEGVLPVSGFCLRVEHHFLLLCPGPLRRYMKLTFLKTKSIDIKNQTDTVVPSA